MRQQRRRNTLKTFLSLNAFMNSFASFPVTTLEAREEDTKTQILISYLLGENE